jgi:hypothetical protein
VTLGTASTESRRTVDQDGLRRIVIIVAACLVAFAIVFPRSATAIFLIPAVASFGAWVTRPQWRAAGLPLSGLALALIGFAAWSLLSASWSVAPLASLTKPLFLIAGVIGLTALFDLARRCEPDMLAAVAHGILLGFFGGAALVSIEILTDQAITQWFMNTFGKLREGYDKHLVMKDGVVVHVSDGNINRRATMVTMLIVPAGLLLATVTGGRAKRLGITLLVAVCAILLAASTHQSSQVAILAGAIAFGLAQVSALWTSRAISVAWCASCLLIVPLVLFLHNANLHKNNAVFNSARHRVVIWNATAEGVKKAPLLGIGADATAKQTEIRMKAEEASGTIVKDGTYDVTTARHAHNVFLQVWYELGAVGAVMFMLAGLAALGLCMKAPAIAQPYLLAQFATVSGMIAFSFSIWQLWLQGAIGLGLMGLLIAISIREKLATPSDRQQGI